jgi:hypothetical protein
MLRLPNVGYGGKPELDRRGRSTRLQFMIDENHWLRTQFDTLFRSRSDGRIERENDPDHSPGPHFWLAGCSEGNVFGVGADLASDLAQELESLVATEPPFTHPATPKHLERYLSLLAGNGPVAHELELIYGLHAQPYPSEARIIGYDSAEGRDLMRSWADGIPETWYKLGFRDVADLWTPWCAAVVDGEVASLAFSARLGDAGAELGLVTAKPFRGRGLAAAATAGWSRLLSLSDRTLFYSTSRNNVSSQRVAARLNLRLLGASLRISKA